MTLKDGLNYKEKNAYQELELRMKGLLPPALCEDSSLFYRFLKARDFDVDKAESMLLKHISWRKAHQIDTFLNDFKPREFFHKCVEPTFIGYGKEGDMILYCATGKLEISDVLKCVTMNEYMKCWIWFTERCLKLLKEESEKTGREHTQFSFIIDLKELTIANAADRGNGDLWLRLTHHFQDNYPERMKSAYVINAPSYYVLVYSILKPVMSSAMRRKIHVFGQNGYQNKLLDVIDADLLPAFLGGERTDPDGNPMCNTFVCHGGKISSCYYLSVEDRYFKDKSQVKLITLPKKGGREEIIVDVTESGSLIHWEFLVKNKDINFGLSLQVSEETVKEVLPLEKYYTSDGIEEGSYRCQLEGKYVIIFQNSQSWLNCREIQYCVTVIKPE